MQIIKTLFLDRDGVINKENEGDYIKSVAEFEFLPGVLEAIAEASKIYDYILIATNQRGIGRNLMSEQDLHDIHADMLAKINEAGGRIDDIFFAPSPDKKHPYRKPNPGMALAAKEKFPEIDFLHAEMVGNNISDMCFGKAVGMRTIFLHTTQEAKVLPHDWIDEQYDSLASFIATKKK